MHKIRYILLLNDILQDKGVVVKAKYMKMTGVSELTFRRYMRDLRDYYETKKPMQTIDYDKIRNAYVLGTKVEKEDFPTKPPKHLK
jgi:predicted DNA-binding transcriptional regulator YafY